MLAHLERCKFDPENVCLAGLVSDQNAVSGTRDAIQLTSGSLPRERTD
jgi:hypothetical protein